MKGLLSTFLILISVLARAIEYKKIENNKEVAVASVETYSFLLLFVATLVGFYLAYKKTKL